MAGEGGDGDDNAASAERERVRLENERLRAENLRLRAAVAATQPNEPPASNIALVTPRGGTLDAADERVQLMREGGQLLKEKEGLMSENSVLQRELGTLVEDIAPGEGAPVLDLEAEIDRVVGEEETDLDALERLLPLLNEGDALCAEREGLKSEHRELIGTLEALGAAPQRAGDEASLEDLLAEAGEPGDLQSRLRRAMEDVKRENTSLEAEVHQLRDDNTRLRHDHATALASPSFAPKLLAPPAPVIIQPASPKIRKQMSTMMTLLQTPTGKEDALMAELTAPETEDERQDAQREAMASLLRRHIAEEAVPSPRMSPLKVPQVSERRLAAAESNPETSNIALKSALHELFRNFAR